MRLPQEGRIKRHNLGVNFDGKLAYLGDFLGKNANFRVHFVQKLHGFQANCTQIAPDKQPGKIISIILFSNCHLDVTNYDFFICKTWPYESYLSL